MHQKIPFFLLTTISIILVGPTAASTSDTKAEKKYAHTLDTGLKDLQNQTISIQAGICKQAVHDFDYLRDNAKSLIANYKHRLKSEHTTIDNHKYSLLALIDKMQQKSKSITHTNLSQHLFYSTWSIKSVFYIGDLLCRKEDIIHLHRLVKRIIADEIKKPSTDTQKAATMFRFLQKESGLAIDYKNKAITDLIENFRKTCHHLTFADTQTNSYIFPYTYFIQLATAVKSCGAKKKASKNLKPA